MKILIVDDSKTIRSIVKHTLQQTGFGDHEVEEASNGVEALHTIQAWAPDIVLADWHMPEMNGIELLEKLTEKGISVKFGFVTSEGTPEMRKRAEVAGAAFLIDKPFTTGTFQKAFSAAIT